MYIACNLALHIQNTDQTQDNHLNYADNMQ